VARLGVPREVDALGGGVEQGHDGSLHHGGRHLESAANYDRPHALRRRDLRPLLRVAPRKPRAVVWVVGVPDHGEPARPVVAPGEQDQRLRRVHLRVERALHRPHVQPGDERRPGASVDEANLHRVRWDDGDDLGDQRNVGAGDVHRLPEVDAEVEVEHRGLAEPVVVAVHERGSEDVLGPRCHGPDGVAAARGVREAAHIEVALREGRVDVLGGDVAVGAGVGEANVGDVRQLGGAVHVAALSWEAAVYAYES